MQQIKNIFNCLDYIVSLWWGLTLMDILPLLSSGYVFSSLDNIIKSLFALVGLIYAIVRCYFYYMKGVRENARAILEEKKMEQEIENQKAEFYKKFNNEFLKNNK